MRDEREERIAELQLASNFVHLFALLLWVGAFLAWLAGMPQLCWAIVVVILINGVFSYWQEYQAERAAEALQALLPRQVMVKRGSEEQLIDATEVVPGDILLLAEGAAIPADARVLVAERLRVDMSSLTGESKPVPRVAHEAKTESPVSTVGLPNLVFAGTSVVSGRGEAVVFATGANSEFGRIAQITQTSTLTENEMTVRELWTSGLDYRVGGRGYETSGKLERVGNNSDNTFAQELLRIAALCSDAHLRYSCERPRCQNYESNYLPARIRQRLRWKHTRG